MATPQIIDISRASPPIHSGQLRLGGTNPLGQQIGFTNFYMTRNGQPCIPVMGEFHFSRYAHEYWEEALLKIKAGGVEIVATYVFWNHVEAEEGIFDWSGNNALREFLILCSRHDLQVVVRIGPFAHGECRNGGMPDWLYGRPFNVRSNDERYLAYVRRLYGEIARQLDGLLFKNGGPVVGIQLENEYMHAGAPWEVTFRQGTEYVPSGTDGAAHMLLLKQMARDAGMDVPLYTCTGWLRSPVPEGEMLPMQGGYVFTPWVPDPEYQQPPTREFLFRDRHQHPVINGVPTYDAPQYPYACCEIGGGTQDTYYHRNPVPPEAVEGLAFVNLAGGANLIGYYMYHGGTNPVGRNGGYLNEYTVPRRSYDFQAPLREFGQVAASYRSLRLLHQFLRDFGDLLAPMQVTLPENAGAITPENVTDVRYAVRSKDGAGFLFLNSYQDHVEMPDLHDLRFEVRTSQGSIPIPRTQTLTLKRNVSAMLPFGLTLGGIRLRSATTQLLAKLDAAGVVSYVFFAPKGMVSEYVLERASFRSIRVEGGEAQEIDGETVVQVQPGLAAVITLVNPDGGTVRLLTLTREQAEQASKQSVWGRERLIISDADVVADRMDCWLYSRAPQADLWIYPPLEAPLASAGDTVPASTEGLFSHCRLSLPRKDIDLNVGLIAQDRAVVTVSPAALDGLSNLYLVVDYSGDMGSCFIDGRLVSDNLNNGTAWELGLKQIFADRAGDELFVLITPKRRHKTQPGSAGAAMAYVPEIIESGAAVIHGIRAVPEYKFNLTLQSR